MAYTKFEKELKEKLIINQGFDNFKKLQYKGQYLVEKYGPKKLGEVDFDNLKQKIEIEVGPIGVIGSGVTNNGAYIHFNIL